MKQMQSDRYKLARKVNLEVEQLDAKDAPLDPGELSYLHDVCIYFFFFKKSCIKRKNCLFNKASIHCIKHSSLNFKWKGFYLHFNSFNIYYALFSELPVVKKKTYNSAK